MTDPKAISAAMHRVGQAMQKAIMQTLVIPPEPSALPSPDDPLYELHRAQHRTIARLRGRPCPCGTCD